MKVSSFVRRYFALISQASDIPLMCLRLVLAFGFFQHALNKWENIDAIALWFESMGYPFPYFNTYLVATTELIGVVCLVLGFATRLITVPLMLVILVAIFTVHLENGFPASQNGVEIPLYYLIMLLCLHIFGSGRASVDWLINSRFSSSPKSKTVSAEEDEK